MRITDKMRIDALELAATEDPLLLHDQIITGSAKGCNHRGLGLLLSTGRTLRQAIDQAFILPHPYKKRDPRVDPKAGDELEYFHGGTIRWYRGVTSAHGGGVRYATDKGRSRYMRLSTWRETMRNAKVLRVAQ